MKNRKRLLIGALFLMLVAISFSLFKKDVWEKNEVLLKEAVLAIEPSVETVNLKEITPFEWDVVYSFDPYTTKEVIYETVGYKWDRIQETVSEGMNQIVFLNDGKVVCYLYGYPENNGYGIFIKGENVGSATMLTVSDDVTFEVERSDKAIYLNRMH